MTPAPVWELLRKELRQVGRNRSAMLSATLLPALLMVIVPLPQLASLQELARSEELPQLPGLSGLSDPASLFTQLLYPLLLTITGLMLPSLSATYTVVNERERRTVDLLVALPVSIADILVAKLLSIVVLSLMVTVPLLAIVVTAMTLAGIASAGLVLSYLLILAASLICSTCFSLVLALLARDFRTANNLNGLLFVPLLLLTVLVVGVVGGVGKFLAISALMVVAAAVAVVVALRLLTLERYLE